MIECVCRWMSAVTGISQRWGDFSGSEVRREGRRKRGKKRAMRELSRIFKVD